MTKLQRQILAIYDALDDEDISTERLFAMVSDAAGVEVEDVVQALALWAKG